MTEKYYSYEYFYCIIKCNILTLFCKLKYAILICILIINNIAFKGIFNNFKNINSSFICYIITAMWKCIHCMVVQNFDNNNNDQW